MDFDIFGDSETNPLHILRDSYSYARILNKIWAMALHYGFTPLINFLVHFRHPIFNSLLRQDYFFNAFPPKLFVDIQYPL